MNPRVQGICTIAVARTDAPTLLDQEGEGASQGRAFPSRSGFTGTGTNNGASKPRATGLTVAEDMNNRSRKRFDALGMMKLLTVGTRDSSRPGEAVARD
jgi:hypothetical protein